MPFTEEDRKGFTWLIFDLGLEYKQKLNSREEPGPREQHTLRHRGVKVCTVTKKSSVSYLPYPNNVLLPCSNIIS